MLPRPRSPSESCPRRRGCCPLALCVLHSARTRNRLTVAVIPIGADLLVGSSGEKERERGKRFPLGRGEIEVGRKPHGAETEKGGGAAGTAEGTRARTLRKEGKRVGLG